MSYVYEGPNWRQPDPSAHTDPAGPPLPDENRLVTDEPLPETETVLAELGAFYPIVAYPDAQDSASEVDDATQIDRTIFAGLVSG